MCVYDYTYLYSVSWRRHVLHFLRYFSWHQAAYHHRSIQYRSLSILDIGDQIQRHVPDFFSFGKDSIFRGTDIFLSGAEFHPKGAKKSAPPSLKIFCTWGKTDGLSYYTYRDTSFSVSPLCSIPLKAFFIRGMCPLYPTSGHACGSLNFYTISYTFFLNNNYNLTKG